MNSSTILLHSVQKNGMSDIQNGLAMTYWYFFQTTVKVRSAAAVGLKIMGRFQIELLQRSGCLWLLKKKNIVGASCCDTCTKKKEEKSGTWRNISLQSFSWWCMMTCHHSFFSLLTEFALRSSYSSLHYHYTTCALDALPVDCYEACIKLQSVEHENCKWLEETESRDRQLTVLCRFPTGTSQMLCLSVHQLLLLRRTSALRYHCRLLAVNKA